MLNLSKHTTAKPKPKPTLIFEYYSHVYAYLCVRLSYTAQNSSEKLLMVGWLEFNVPFQHNSSDDLPYCPLDNHHSSDDVYWMGAGPNCGSACVPYISVACRRF